MDVDAVKEPKEVVRSVIEFKVDFWTNNFNEEQLREFWSLGKVTRCANHRLGIRHGEHSIKTVAEIGPAIEDLAAEAKITIHPTGNLRFGLLRELVPNANADRLICGPQQSLQRARRKKLLPKERRARLRCLDTVQYLADDCRWSGRPASRHGGSVGRLARPALDVGFTAAPVPIIGYRLPWRIGASCAYC